ncbi:chemotaxis protein [Lysinibacillus yapensis]|uniref:Chemotaxis protein n=1 Tax=Ureibacillus yapensis TaxID=2304605 RepID=A0A396S5C1_9BACL|nr:globin-coupled sensor protein [Lysinibacillus yapensis]RHW34714.1 chemotaxis protein [Lysinibacillus yapensis]
MLLLKKQAKKEEEMIFNAPVSVQLDFHGVTSHPDISKQLEFIEFKVEDAALLKNLQPYIAQHIEEIVEAFYKQILLVPSLKHIIQENSTVNRLKQTLQVHIIEMFSGDINQEYIQKRLKVAHIHFKIGLLPKWYIGAFQQVLVEMIKHINRMAWLPQHKEAAILVASKIISFETQLVLEEYDKENLRLREMDYERVKGELKDNISILSKNLAELTEETNSSVNQVVQQSLAINEGIQSSVQQTRFIQKEAQEGTDLVEKLELQMETIALQTNGMNEIVEQLKVSSDQITQIVSLVKQIADQTNLLSLNASIEAARAGSHGRGFAVVAEEVRKLAAQSKQSVEQITDLTNHSSNLTAQAVQTTNGISDLVNKSLANSTLTQEKFHIILDSIMQSEQQISSVDEGMNNFVQIIREIGNYYSKVADSAKQLNEATIDL